MFKKLSILVFAFTPMFCASTNVQNSEQAEVVLTKYNTVVMESKFTGAAVAQVMLDARKLHFKLRAGKPIYLVINSPGGSIEAGIELIDNLNALGRTIHTVTIFSASMGFQTVQGVNGTRYTTPTGTLMSHKASGGFRGEFPGQLDSRYQYYLKRLEKMDEKTVARSGGKLTLESYRAMYENEYWCEGQDCVDKGLADKATLVSCDKTLNGTKAATASFGFMGLSVKAKSVKAACPTITGAVSQNVSINGVDIALEAIPGRAEFFGITVNQATELQKLIQKKLEQITPTHKHRL